MAVDLGFWAPDHAAVMLPQVAMERANPAIIQDRFTGGTPELAWRPYPYFNQDNLKGKIHHSSPEGEPGVGVLDNQNAGGFAALSYADTRPLEDFYLEAWLHVQMTEEEKGSLNGIAIRVDPVQRQILPLCGSLHRRAFIVVGLRRQRLKTFPGHPGGVEARGSSRRSSEAERLAPRRNRG